MPVIQAPFTQGALRTGFDGWRLSDVEAEMLAVQADAVIRRYMPAQIGPHGALLTFGASLAIVSAIRYVGYIDWKFENAKRVQSFPSTPEPQPPQSMTTQQTAPRPEPQPGGRTPAKSILATVKTAGGPGSLTAESLAPQNSG